jgi:hypothetical protein
MKFGHDGAHNLFIRFWAKKGFKLPLTYFENSELEGLDDSRLKGHVTRRTPVQIQPRYQFLFHLSYLWESTGSWNLSSTSKYSDKFKK